jgi:hypothetical protein
VPIHRPQWYFICFLAMHKYTQRPHNSAQKSQAESNFTHKRQGPGAKPRAKGTAGHRLTRPRSGLATRRASDGALVPIHLTLTLNVALTLTPTLTLTLALALPLALALALALALTLTLTLAIALALAPAPSPGPVSS